MNIEIYDITGKWIFNLVGDHMWRGTHNLHWKGIDINGNPVASGSYLILMKYGGSVKTKKIKLIK